jgi:hypothetical protein
VGLEPGPFGFVSTIEELLGITGFLDFVHRPEFQITRKRNVSETESLCVFKRGQGDTYSFWVP